MFPRIIGSLTTCTQPLRYTPPHIAAITRMTSLSSHIRPIFPFNSTLKRLNLTSPKQSSSLSLVAAIFIAGCLKLYHSHKSNKKNHKPDQKQV